MRASHLTKASHLNLWACRIHEGPLHSRFMIYVILRLENGMKMGEFEAKNWKIFNAGRCPAPRRSPRGLSEALPQNWQKISSKEDLGTLTVHRARTPRSRPVPQHRVLLDAPAATCGQWGVYSGVLGRRAAV